MCCAAALSATTIYEVLEVSGVLSKSKSATKTDRILAEESSPDFVERSHREHPVDVLLASFMYEQRIFVTPYPACIFGRLNTIQAKRPGQRSSAAA